jgi:hypothetical protein
MAATTALYARPAIAENSGAGMRSATTVRRRLTGATAIERDRRMSVAAGQPLDPVGVNGLLEVVMPAELEPGHAETGQAVEAALLDQEVEDREPVGG